MYVFMYVCLFNNVALISLKARLYLVFSETKRFNHLKGFGFALLRTDVDSLIKIISKISLPACLSTFSTSDRTDETIMVQQNLTSVLTVEK